MTRLIESIPVENLKDITHLDVEVYYDKGGASLFSGGVMPRGYRVSVRPVCRKGNSVSFSLFSGTVKFLMPTHRFSQKQFEKAVEL
ncbi:MAG: hypothetical protein LBT12_04285, partial [Oscillospiraceae bacterium]|nr:hypothetical protein [Oscillospiraceae bacterium]